MYLRDEVIVLKKSPYRELDRQYVMYGRKHGLLLAVARGCVNIKSKQAGRLEPLSVADVMIAKGRNLDHLAVASHVPRTTSHVPRTTSLGAFVVCGAFADLCLKLIRPGVADERLFNLWIELLDSLSGLPQELSAVRAQLLFAAASLKLMDTLGYGPSLRACLSCHKPPGPTDAWYAPTSNGLVCADCISSWHEHAISAKAHSLALLRFMRSSPLSDVLRVGLNVDVAQNAIRLIKEVWQHAPLDREPHGMETIERMLA
ncbi:MAG: DNA repair protein RecO [Patescibacteria group bacterium]|jgi:DNA repair protein RecO